MSAETVEEVRDRLPKNEALRLEQAALDFAREAARVFCWREVRPNESIYSAVERIMNEEFGKALDMDFDMFCDLSGFEISFESAA